MNMSQRIAWAGAVVAISVGASGLAFSSDSAPAAVAQFIKALAIDARLQPSDPKTSKGATVKPAAAWAGLDSNAPLTYATVSRIARELGVQVAPPANPDAVVSSAQAGAIASLLAAVHGGASVTLPADDVPSQCLTSDNRGRCVDCCKAASGDGGQFCGRFCHANVPPPVSPGEPQP
jgi:hypothetical protein